MIKVEVKQKIVEARFQSVWDVLEGEQAEEFGAWIKRQFGKNVPPELKPKEVIDFMDKNPSKFNLSPAQLVQMFLAKNQIKAKFASKKVDKDLNDIASAMGTDLKADSSTPEEEESTHIKQGEMTLKDLGIKLGVTTERARQIVDKVQEKIKIRADFLRDDPDGFADIIDSTLDRYVRLLQKVGLMDRQGGEEGDSAAAILNDFLVSENIVKGELSDHEKVILQHLAELAADGETGHVEQLVMNDFVKTDNVLSSFQELVSRAMHKRDQDMGLAKKRGAPKKIKP